MLQWAYIQRHCVLFISHYKTTLFGRVHVFVTQIKTFVLLVSALHRDFELDQCTKSQGRYKYNSLPTQALMVAKRGIVGLFCVTGWVLTIHSANCQSREGREKRLLDGARPFTPLFRPRSVLLLGLA